MIGKLKNNITRFNKEHLIKKYKTRIIIFSCVCVLILLLMPFTAFFNKLLKIYPDIPLSEHHKLEIHTVDVGQGLCVMIHFPNGENMIFDTGISEKWRVVDSYVSKVLLRSGGNIDYLVISHPDNDHSGNAESIMRKYKPKEVFIPSMQTELEDGSIAYYSDFCNFIHSINNTNKINYNIAGLKKNISGVSITWLAPNRDYYSASNDYSCVLLIQYGNFSMLLTADAGHNTNLTNRVDVEAEVMSYADANNINVDVDVMLLGHHGSKYSTSTEFLNFAKPEVAIISVGDNTYGHPANEVYQNIFEYDKTNNTKLISNVYSTLHNDNIIIGAGSVEGYIVTTIDDVDNYLHISFVWICVLAILPFIYLLLDSILIYINIFRQSKKEH